MTIVSGFGLDFCCQCGLGRTGMVGEVNEWFPSDRVMWVCNYTRQKRFKKYLNRANRNQSCATIPAETWQYLMKHAPYKGPREIYNRLKRGKGIKRKCYDSLPLICQHLCEGNVPTLSDLEVREAMRHFNTIDSHVERSGDRMISYIFCLEFILKKMGRHDMLPYVAKIKCPRRRRNYQQKLSEILGSTRTDTVTDRDVMSMLRRGE